MKALLSSLVGRIDNAHGAQRARIRPGSKPEELSESYRGSQRNNVAYQKVRRSRRSTISILSAGLCFGWDSQDPRWRNPDRYGARGHLSTMSSTASSKVGVAPGDIKYIC